MTPEKRHNLVQNLKRMDGDKLLSLYVSYTNNFFKKMLDDEWEEEYTLISKETHRRMNNAAEREQI